MAGMEFFSGSGPRDARAAPLVPRLLGRERAVTRLLVLDGRGELATEHVRLVRGSSRPTP